MKCNLCINTSAIFTTLHVVSNGENENLPHQRQVLVVGHKQSSNVYITWREIFLYGNLIGSAICREQRTQLI